VPATINFAKVIRAEITPAAVPIALAADANALQKLGVVSLEQLAQPVDGGQLHGSIMFTFYWLIKFD